MKVYILGAGISGAIMYSILKDDFDVTVIEKSKPAAKEHKAVMHFQDPEIGRILNIELKKAIVRKCIYHNGEYYNEPNLFLSNLYSLKTIGVLESRSIIDLSDKERWVGECDVNFSKVIDPESNSFNMEVTSIKDGNIFYGNRASQYDIIISTIPLFRLLALLGEPCNIEFVYNPIWVYRTEFKEKFSSVFQTFYFPDPDYPIYRATIDEGLLIIESLKKCDDMRQVISALRFIGISDYLFSKEIEWEESIQRIGKIKPIDDLTRKSLLYGITSKYNIYSLGRFALWQNIRTGDVYKDALKIKSMIKTPEEARKYIMWKEIN
jgi:hypothetical protein